MFFKSIRWRLQLWYGLILVLVLAGFGLTAYQLERGRQLRRVDDELQRRAGALANALRQPPRNRGPNERPFGLPDENVLRRERPRLERPFNDGPPENFPRRPFQLLPQHAALFDENDTNGFYYIIRARNGEELARSSNAPPGAIQFTERSPEAPPVPLRPVPPRPPEPQPPMMRGISREMILRPPSGELILVGRSTAREQGELRRTALRLASVGGIILAFGLAGGWWLASRAIRPIKDISDTALKISAGDLSQRINIAETESELGQLATVLNSTFARLDAAFAQQSRFTADAAHELRTPVSVMLTQTQSALARDRDAAEYRETLETCQRATQRMRRLIESLLELARLDAGQETMKHIQFDLSKTARDCVDTIQPLAVERGIKIECDLAQTNCVGDPERIAQVITNLLTNAIHYNRDNGNVFVTVRQSNGSAHLTVKDTGAGISAEDLPHVFERFYRAEKSRSSGHAGLGLAISKAIVEAHGGIIEASASSGEGSTFTVVF